MPILARIKHYLIPQESNNYRARVLHNQSISTFAILFLVFQLSISTIILVKPKVLGYAAQISPTRVVELTNQERAKVGAGPVTLNSLLVEAATRKAGDMFAFDYWAHVSPSGREPWAFFREVGYNYIYAGENLARDFSSPEAAVSAWMASPSHKENLLNPKYKEIGIAVVDGTLGGIETTLVVQLFGSRSQATAQKVVPTKSPVQAIAKVQPQASPVPTVMINEEEVVTEQKTVAPETGVNVQSENAPPSMITKPSGAEVPMVNPFTLTQLFALISFGVLLGLFIADAYVIWKHRIIRLSGRPFAHAMFLVGMMLIIFLSQRGVII